MDTVSSGLELDERSFAGQVLTPEAPGYDLHRRIWNGSFDRRPALILLCTNSADVGAAVMMARARDLPVTVRSGGIPSPDCRWLTTRS